MSDRVMAPEARAALDAFRAIKFTGYVDSRDMDAALAMCALFDIPVSQDGKSLVNRNNGAFASDESSIRTFLESFERTRRHLQKPVAVDISQMNVKSQQDAKEYVRRLMDVLEQEVATKFPEPYARIKAARTEARLVG